MTFLGAAWGARLGRPRPTLPLAESPCPFKTSIFIGLCGPARAARDIRGPPPARELRVRRAGERAVESRGTPCTSATLLRRASPDGSPSPRATSPW